MKAYRRLPSIKMEREGPFDSEDIVAIESVLELRLGTDFLAAFICTPGFERELAIGYLLSTGLLTTMSAVQNIVVRNRKATITLKYGETINKDRGFSQIRRFMSTECSAPEMLIELHTGGSIPTIHSSHEVSLDDIEQLVTQVKENQKIRRLTGATHASYIHDKSADAGYLAEDIGRHNAVDKAIGLAVEAGSNLQECYLYSTGRLTADIVSKCAWTMIPLVISSSAATDAGIQFAKKANITLIGWVKGRQCRIYHTGAVRVNWS
jgi:FdhD protein